MPAPIDPEKRAAIEQSIRDNAGTCSRNAIAKQHGVAASTVGKIAREAGIEGAFDRAQTKNATRARTVDMAEERSLVKAMLLRKSRSLIEAMDEPVTVYNFGGATNEFNSVELLKPTPVELKLLITSAAIALDKHIAIEKHDTTDDTGGAAVDTWLRNVLGRD